MMLVWFLITGAAFLVLANPHPLNIQPYPITNHQHVYRPPCSEAFVIQPQNINHYSQLQTVETPVPTYQTLQAPYLTDQITQYLDTVLSEPSLRSILDPNLIACDQRGKDLITNLHPYNTGGVVNNYIIVPPDYIKLNETKTQAKTKRIGNELRKKGKEKITSHGRKRKLTNNNKDYIKNVKAPNKTQNKVKSTWSFNTDNIKCFTPVDVLKNEKYQPDNKVNKNKDVEKQCYKSNRNAKPTNYCGNKIKTKSTNSNKKKVRNKSIENTIKKCRNTKAKTKNIPSLNTTHKKTKRRKKEPVICNFSKRDDLSEKIKKEEEKPQICDQDIEDLLLSALLQQSCSNLENRCIRNPKTDTAKKDLRSIYPDLPDDVPNTFSSYLSDLYSPHALQKTLNSNLGQGNKYPFDFSQIYQIPQYSSADLNKSQGNSDKNKNIRRKKKMKKKKKNSKTKTRNEGTSNISGPDKNIPISKIDTDISGVHIETSKATTQNQDTSAQIFDEIVHAPDISNASKKNSHTNPESTIKTTFVNNKFKSVELPPVPSENTTTEIVVDNVKDVTQHSEEILPNKVLNSWEEDLESEELDTKESYETQIPFSVVVHTDREANTKIKSESEEEVTDEKLPILDYDQNPRFDSEDEIFNLIGDYFPDFRADNHAYLVSDEEIDTLNTHDRYFYVTDKNNDSKEIYSAEEINQLDIKKNVYNEDNLQDLDKSKRNDNKNDESQEITFKAPPGLDSPDFITRKINTDSKERTEIYYKHKNNFEDFNNSDNFDDESDNTMNGPSRTDNSRHIVETVYAKSKVVKYGQGEESKAKSEPRTSLPNNDGKIQSDKTAVVIAKSLEPGDYW